MGLFITRQHTAYTLSTLYAIARPSLRPSHGCIIQQEAKLSL